MDKASRRALIAIGIVCGLLFCCAASGAAATVGLWRLRGRGQVSPEQGPNALAPEAGFDHTLSVGQRPALEVQIHAGEVHIRRGAEGVIQVTTTVDQYGLAKPGDLLVEMEQHDGLVAIRSVRSQRLVNLLRRDLGSAYARIEIAAPQGTVVDLVTNEGMALIEDISGDMRVRNGSGSIVYRGEPQGHCAFETWYGDVILALPAELDVKVDLTAVDGEVAVSHPLFESLALSPTWVQGKVGVGGPGAIRARAEAGWIFVEER